MKHRAIYMPVFILAAMALLLLGASGVLNGVQAKRARAAREKKMQLFLPGGSFAELEYTGADANISQVFQSENGYVIETRVDGYVAPITMRIGVDLNGRVAGLQICELHETPGLGARALRDQAFLSQFLNSNGDQIVGDSVDALSGATVTSKAIARSVNSACAFVNGTDAASGATGWGG